MTRSIVHALNHVVWMLSQLQVLVELPVKNESHVEKLVPLIFLVLIPELGKGTLKALLHLRFTNDT